MRKRILSILLSVCMVLTMLPISAMAAEADASIGTRVEIIAFAPLDETEKSVPTGIVIEDLELPETLTATVRTAVTNYGIWVGGVEVTDVNKDNITSIRIRGKVNYNSDTNTLTLENATIGHSFFAGYNIYNIYAEHDLKIVLVGTNSVTGYSLNGYKSRGIYNTTGALEISGNGSLDVSGGSGTASYGIYAKGNLTISSGTITATSESSSGTSSAICSDGQVIISGGEVTATGSQMGIIGALSVTDGTVTAQGDTKALDGTLTTSGYTGGCAITADTDKNGSNAGAYDASSLATYQYIKVGPTVPQAQWGVAGSDGSAPTAWTQGTLADAISYVTNLPGGMPYIQL